MSKWIRERMRRRRKKKGSSADQGESLPPLQPNFLTSELPPPAPELEAEEKPADEAPPVPAIAEPPAATEPAPSGVEGQRAPSRR
ncbi:MAG TPA: hypothetical protein VJ756_06165, partial [Terriglobales bacterium]|nr:hypothetical protein [Terriglobales bacterium]